MEGTKLHLSSYRVETKHEMVVLLINFICLLKKIKLSRIETLVLAHFMIEGYNQMSKEQLLESQVIGSKSTLANTLTSFRNNGIIIKEKYQEVLSGDFRYPITDKININITLDNS